MFIAETLFFIKYLVQKTLPLRRVFLSNYFLVCNFKVAGFRPESEVAETVTLPA